MKSDKLYLVHIAESIRRVEIFTAEGEKAFFADIRTQDAVLRNLQVLSESTKRLSPEVTARFPHIDWKGIAGFRNVLVHDYLGLRLDRVWEVIRNEIPPLKAVIDELLAELGVSLDNK